MYIVFEGLVRSGKTTQAKLLVEYLKRKYPNRKVTYVREPGSSLIAEAIRKLVQGTKFDEEMKPVTNAYLYAASRAQALREVVRPALKYKGIVVSDRSFVTSLAWQGGAQGLGVDRVLEINREAIEGFWPDLIICLDNDPKLSLSRTLNPDEDKWEAKGVKFFRKARKVYLSLPKRKEFRKIFKIVDGNGTIEEVQHRIIDVIEKQKGMLNK